MTGAPFAEHVAGLSAGDRAAVAGVYEATSDWLASIAMGLLGNREQAADAVQDTFVRFTMSLGSFRGDDERAVRGYLVRILRNRCLDIRKSAASRLESPTDAPPDTPVDDDVHAQALSPELAGALGQLSDDARSALVLTHVGGLQGAEVAAVMGRSRAATYALVRRAERTVRAALEQASNRTAPSRLHDEGTMT